MSKVGGHYVIPRDAQALADALERHAAVAAELERSSLGHKPAARAAAVRAYRRGGAPEGEQSAEDAQQVEVKHAAAARQAAAQRTGAGGVAARMPLNLLSGSLGKSSERPHVFKIDADFVTCTQ